MKNEIFPLASGNLRAPERARNCIYLYIIIHIYYFAYSCAPDISERQRRWECTYISRRAFSRWCGGGGADSHDEVARGGKAPLLSHHRIALLARIYYTSGRESGEERRGTRRTHSGIQTWYPHLLYTCIYVRARGSVWDRAHSTCCAARGDL